MTLEMLDMTDVVDSLDLTVISQGVEEFGDEIWKDLRFVTVQIHLEVLEMINHQHRHPEPITRLRVDKVAGIGRVIMVSGELGHFSSDLIEEERSDFGQAREVTYLDIPIDQTKRIGECPDELTDCRPSPIGP